MGKLNFYFNMVLQNIFSPKIIKNSKVSKHAKVCRGCALRNVSVDDYSYIGECANISYCNIGKFCSIAGYTSIGGGSHPLEFVSTSPVFCEGKNTLNKNFAEHRFYPYSTTTIENDVWIGKGASIKAGVTIKTGAVVGMGSVVTKDIGPYEIWAGNPAKLIRKRFDDETIDTLLSSEWWLYDEEKLHEVAKSFNDVESFVKELKGNNNDE